ncbi:MAG: hypothetical protein KC561_14510, partial [Myxococcales bacterium]|nr:hypothetical protein [Myxococcales bacterium]
MVRQSDFKTWAIALSLSAAIIVSLLLWLVPKLVDPPSPATICRVMRQNHLGTITRQARANLSTGASPALASTLATNEWACFALEYEPTPWTLEQICDFIKEPSVSLPLAQEQARLGLFGVPTSLVAGSTSRWVCAEPQERVVSIVALDLPETEEIPEEADYEDRVNRVTDEETVARDRVVANLPLPYPNPALQSQANEAQGNPNPNPRPRQPEASAEIERQETAEEEPEETETEPETEEPEEVAEEERVEEELAREELAIAESETSEATESEDTENTEQGEESSESEDEPIDFSTF